MAVMKKTIRHWSSEPLTYRVIKFKKEKLT